MLTAVAVVCGRARRRQSRCQGQWARYDCGVVQANAFAIPPDAPRADVEALVRGAAKHLGIEAPSIAGDHVAFSADQDAVVEALDTVDADWRQKGLLLQL